MIFLVDVWGEAPRQYISEALAVGGLAISPDGQQLAYATLPLGSSTWTLWFADPDGGEARPTMESEVDLRVVAWSPDGERLLFLYGAHLCLIDRDGGDFRPLGVWFAGTWAQPLPQWSPDGTLIAYTEEVRSPEKQPEGLTDREGIEFESLSTYLVDTHSGERRALVEEGAVGDLYSAWSPDGQQLAFLSMRSGAIEVWLVGRDGSGLRPLTETGQTHSAPVWVPSTKGE